MNSDEEGGSFHAPSEPRPVNLSTRNVMTSNQGEPSKHKQAPSNYLDVNEDNEASNDNMEEEELVQVNYDNASSFFSQSFANKIATNAFNTGFNDKDCMINKEIN